jgi:Zn ribbon nucleic-acid-binding protein
MYPSRLALSRLDNITKVCPDCGTQEAIEQWQNGEVKEWRREYSV